MDMYIIPVLLLTIISFSLLFIYNSFTIQSNNKLGRYAGKSFFDLLGIIPLIALFLGIMVLLLKAISILMSFTINFKSYYIIIIASVFICIMSRIIASIFTYVTSVALANKYLKEDLDEYQMKKMVIDKRRNIKKTKVIFIFIIVLICYSFVVDIIGLNYSFLLSIICAIMNTIAYIIIFKLIK
jgi:hypothetical protein